MSRLKKRYMVIPPNQHSGLMVDGEPTEAEIMNFMAEYNTDTIQVRMEYRKMSMMDRIRKEMTDFKYVTGKEPTQAFVSADIYAELLKELIAKQKEIIQTAALGKVIGFKDTDDAVTALGIRIHRVFTLPSWSIYMYAGTPPKE